MYSQTLSSLQHIPTITPLLDTMIACAKDNTLQWNRSLSTSIEQAIKKIDEKISEQLRDIMHNPHFLELEGHWRGLHHLVKNTETSETLYIKVLQLTKTEMSKDLQSAIAFDQSELFKIIYDREFGTPGGMPFNIMIGDYEFINHPQDLEILTGISNIAAAAFCPFISAAHATFFGLNQWTDLSKPRDLNKIFDSIEYTKWRSYRESDDSRFTVLTLPRVLARMPYGAHTNPVTSFKFEEAPLHASGELKEFPHENYCWMNAAYALGERISNAFIEYGWCTAIRGTEGGGKVSNLPLHIFKSDSGDVEIKCPTEVGITDRREAELSQLGFLPLCHFKNTDYAVFFGADSTQKPKSYQQSSATANAQISARLPYLLATSRFSHYLKVMARDKIGAFMQANDVEDWLNHWILNYVNSNATSKQDLKAKYPLAEAKIKVESIAEKPGAYQAVLWLKPWLQLEELTSTMRLVAEIPSLKK